MTKLKDYCAAISHATGVPIPGSNYPAGGRRSHAFRTGTGVHAAAVIKASSGATGRQACRRRLLPEFRRMNSDSNKRSRSGL